jgi:hypothetical protein
MQKQAAAQRAEQDELRRLREELKEKNRLRGATLRTQRQQQQQQIVAIREQMQRDHSCRVAEALRRACPAAYEA